MSSSSSLQAGVRPREVWAWAMYDFANSGYTTVVITAVFGAYFVAVVAGDAPWATFAWTLALSASYALIMATAPAIGAWADARARKKALLWLTTLGCVGATAALSAVRVNPLWSWMNASAFVPATIFSVSSFATSVASPSTSALQYPA